MSSRASVRRAVLVDGGLAAACLLAVLGALAALDAPLDPVAAGLGGVGGVLVETALARRHAAAREAWARPRVKAAVVAAFLLLVAAAATAVPSAGLSALAGGLFTYLLMLAGYAFSRVLVAGD